MKTLLGNMQGWLQKNNVKMYRPKCMVWFLISEMWHGHLNDPVKSSQVNCLNDFIERKSLKVLWNHRNSSKDYTYTIYALGHKSCIDHILMSGNIYENIIKKNMLTITV